MTPNLLGHICLLRFPNRSPLGCGQPTGGRERVKQALDGQRLLPWLVCACTFAGQDAPPRTYSSVPSRALSSSFSIHPIINKHRHRYPDTTSSGLSSHFYRYSKHERALRAKTNLRAETTLRAKTTRPCRGRRSSTSTRQHQSDPRTVCHIPPSTIPHVQGRRHSSTHVQRKHRYATPAAKPHPHSLLAVRTMGLG